MEKHPLRYRFLRLWRRRHAHRLHGVAYGVCVLAPRVAVLVVGGQLVRVIRA